jgi:hypothetical protein
MFVGYNNITYHRNVRIEFELTNDKKNKNKK